MQLTQLSKLHVMPPCVKIVNGQNISYANNSNMHVSNIFTSGKLRMITIHSPAQGQHFNLKPFTKFHHQSVYAGLKCLHFQPIFLQEELALSDLL